jgi:hypothetical protein
MDQAEIKRMAKRNPGVNLDLLRRAQEERKRLFVPPAEYNLEPPFGRSRRSATVRETAADVEMLRAARRSSV